MYNYCYCCFVGSQPGWGKNVRYLGTKWKMMMSSNLAHRPPTADSLLVVFYEDLKRELARELRRMVEFLDHPCTPEQLNRAVEDGYSAYYRNHTDTFEHYTPDQTTFINNIILLTIQVVQKTNHKNIVPYLNKYISP